MGLTLLILLAAFAAGRLAGGRSTRYLTHRLDAVPLVVAAFAVQALEPFTGRVVAYSYPLSLAVSATLMVQFTARNARVPGVPLAGLGLLLNALVVIANGAMPVSAEAVARAGISAEALRLDTDPRHEPMDGNTRLHLLGDIVPTPIPGHREVDSVGDVALAAGLGLLVFSTAGRRRGIFAAESRVPATRM